MKNNVPPPAPLRQSGATFTCEVCCDQGVLEAVECGCIIFHCPEHMTLCIKDGEVIASRTNGIRQ